MNFLKHDKILLVTNYVLAEDNGTLADALSQNMQLTHS